MGRRSPAVIAQREFPAYLPIQCWLPTLVTVLRLRLTERRLPLVQFRVVIGPLLWIRKNGVCGVDLPQLLCRNGLRVRSTGK